MALFVLLKQWVRLLAQQQKQPFSQIPFKNHNHNHNHSKPYSIGSNSSQSLADQQNNHSHPYQDNDAFIEEIQNLINLISRDNNTNNSSQDVEKLNQLVNLELTQQQQNHIIKNIPGLQIYYEQLIIKSFIQYTKQRPYQNSVFENKLHAILSERGFTSNNTLFGSSICPDELNHRSDSLNTLMKNHWTQVMPIGGLGGIPFAGKTGFQAFASHVPDGGNLLILFGPHVGIDKLGKLGFVERRGQKDVSTSCGAATGAYLHVQNGTHVDIDKDYDHQMDFISRHLVQEFDRIKNAEDTIAELTEVMYELVVKKIFKIVNTKYVPGKLILVGGVQMNTGYGEDYFQPRLFQILEKEQEVQDLLHLL